MQLKCHHLKCASSYQFKEYRHALEIANYVFIDCMLIADSIQFAIREEPHQLNHFVYLNHITINSHKINVQKSSKKIADSARCFVYFVSIFRLRNEQQYRSHYCVLIYERKKWMLSDKVEAWIKTWTVRECCAYRLIIVKIQVTW